MYWEFRDCIKLFRMVSYRYNTFISLFLFWFSSRVWSPSRNATSSRRPWPRGKRARRSISWSRPSGTAPPQSRSWSTRSERTRTWPCRYFALEIFTFGAVMCSMWGSNFNFLQEEATSGNLLILLRRGRQLHPWDNNIHWHQGWH